MPLLKDLLKKNSKVCSSFTLPKHVSSYLKQQVVDLYNNNW